MNMNIYLDESYNFQKEKGKMFISINGFSVLDDKVLRKRWMQMRRSYTKYKRRIHATDPYFEELRKKSISLLNTQDTTIISVFQLIQEIPHSYFDSDKMQFEEVYETLLKCLVKGLSVKRYRQVKIVIDSRKHSGGVFGAYKFHQNMDSFLKKEFLSTKCTFLSTPSYMDVLVELADFVSNTLYKSYMQNIDLFEYEFLDKYIQIKNPL
ncbi:MAG: hypothetical protein A3B90_01675 [Candidatus Magasanikbacteria bacterium RIFCSPHIGHO2_02_FULL_41_13]|uniref:DUF3800 domain-containing protein n=1 Tax=Candidatus Magasanikbacteria bacterium RIFCSPHIGHO2_02_FULL_41_13 TaxID=1798676 RepID=A0A1F6M3W8_9BACT|nr:MAG: hypothetical protein A3B90_01675 [Candidatus Magasanikbacteria bacterium RIFCSPHIGHO2_02_FULL_41_13]